MKRPEYEGREAVANMARKKKYKYAVIAEGALIGLITGALISVFRLMLTWADRLRDMLAEYVRSGGALSAAVCAAVLIAVSIAVSLLLRWEADIAGSGIPQVEAELRGLKDMKWWRVIVAKMAGCALAIGGGLALGREGPSIQLGAMAGKGFARAGHRLLTEERLLVTCGAGAGLSAAFGAPLAGAIFSLEELHRNFSAEVLLTTMAASVAGDFMAANLLGHEPVFGIEIEHGIPLGLYWVVILLGVVPGLLGVLYNKTIDFMQNCFERIDKKTGRMFFIFAVCFVMFFIYPEALGSGGGLVGLISRGEYALPALAVLLVVKFIFSTASFGSGAPGGIFLPLLVLGAITGGLLSRLLGLAGLDQAYLDAFAVISMAGMFAAIVRAPVTGVVLITEMTGDFTSLLPLVLASLTAYVVAESLGAEPIYTQLMQRSMGRNRNAWTSPGLRDRKTVIDAEVGIGSNMDGSRVSEFRLPLGTLIVSVLRDGKEIIPDGNTILKAGDELEILTREADLSDVEDIVDRECGRVELN